MTFTEGSLLLAWLLLVLLTFAMTGLLRQVRELQATIASSDVGSAPGLEATLEPQVPGELVDTATFRGAFAELNGGRENQCVWVIVDPACRSCNYVLSAIASLGERFPDDLDVVVVSTGDIPEGVRGLVESYEHQSARIEQLGPVARPAVLVAQADGSLLSSSATDSLSFLESQLDPDLFSELHRRLLLEV